MRRRKGVSGQIFSIIIFIIIAGVFIAFIREFDYDVFAAIKWIFDWILDLIYRVADMFTGMDGFRRTFR